MQLRAVKERKFKFMKIEDAYGFIGTYLLSAIFFVNLLANIGFIIGIPITIYHLPVCLFLSFIVSEKFFNLGNLQKYLLLCISIIMVALTSIICGYIIDVSWDGAGYHQTIAGTLKNGWNPLQTTFYEFVETRLPFLKNLKAPWYDAYPKGSEIWMATVYKIFNNIETGKSFNIISSIIVFCISNYYFLKNKVASIRQSNILALFLAVNPVILSQNTTSYNDGYMWNIILICLIGLCYITFYNGSLNNISFFLIFASINIGVNIKYSGLLFMGIFCMAFYAFWIVRDSVTCNSWKYAINNNKKVFLLLLSSAISSVVISGCSSYIINIVRHLNPLYVMLGEGKIDVVTQQTPLAFLNLSNISRFIASLFSATSNNKTTDTIDLKFPFTFDDKEFIAAQLNDVRIGGWGILFGGIMILSLLIILKISWTYLKENKKNCILVLTEIYISVIYLLMLIFIPGLYWARYNCFLFYIPVLALLLLIRCKDKKSLVSAGIIIGLLYCNVVPNLVNYGKTIISNKEIYSNNLNDFRSVSENYNVIISSNDSGYFFGGRCFSLIDNNIHNWVYGDITDGSERFSFSPFYGFDYTIIK